MNMEKQAKKFMKGAKANWNKAKRTYVCRSLKDLIKAYRACTTAAEERALVKIEAAQIRDLFREGDKHFRRQNIAKLLFFHMNGYPTDFGITECVKLCASSKFSDKRVAYLGISILVNEGDQVLMLVTNSLKQDLVSHDAQISALALNVLGDIASAEMVRELMPEIEKLLQSPNPTLRKKAGLAAVRAVRKVTSEESANVLDLLPQYFDIKSAAVHISGAALVQALCHQDSQNVTIMQQTVLPTLLKLISDTASANSTQVKGKRSGGKGSTFLQIKLLSAVRSLVQPSMPTEATQNISHALKMISARDEAAKVDGCAILYECVRVAVLIKSDQELLTTAVRILGKFLTHKEATVRYIALQELTGLVDTHGATILSTINDNKKNILAGLHEVDPTMRKQAVELILRITNSENVEEMVTELIEYIKTAETQDAVKDGCEKVFYLADKFGTSSGWKMETFVTTLKLGDRALSENLLLHLVNMVSAHPELQAQALRQLYDGILKEKDSSTDEETLNQKKPYSECAALHILGEHGAAAANAGLTPQQILEVLQRLLRSSEETEEEWLSTGRASMNDENKALGEVAVSAAAKFVSRARHAGGPPDSGLGDLVPSILGGDEKPALLPPPTATNNATDLEASLFGALEDKPTSTALVPADPNADLLGALGEPSAPSKALVPADANTGGLDLLDDMLGGSGNGAKSAASSAGQNVIVSQVSHLLSEAAQSPDVEKQQRACEYLAMLNAGLSPALVQTLAPIPAMSSHQLKVSSKPTRNRLALGQGTSATATGLLLDLMDEGDGASPEGPSLYDVPALTGTSEGPPPALPPMETNTGAGGLHTLEDIFSLGDGQPAQASGMPAAPSTTSGGDLLSAMGAMTVSGAGMSQLGGLEGAGLGLDENNAAREEAQLTTTIVESDAVCVEASFFRDAENESAMRVEIVIGNKTSATVSDACLQLAVPKYMQLEMLPASSSEVEPGERITQTVNIVNSMQGTKAVQLRYRMEFRCEGAEDMTRLEGVVSNLESL